MILVLLMAAFIPAAASGEEQACGEALAWELAEDGTLTISGTGDMYDYEAAADVPWADRAEDIVTVVIWNGVTGIGGNAFNGCTNMTSISIPDGVTKIGPQALNNCRSLSSLNLPQTVTEIGSGMFRQCQNLESVNIPASVEVIEKYAFCNCLKLTDVYYAGTEVQWGDVTIETDDNEYLLGADKHYSALPLVDSGDCGAEGANVQYTLDVYETLTISGTGEMADYGKGNQAPWRWGKTSEVHIGDGVTRIGNWAFRYILQMTEVEIPATVTSIGENAFEGWISLKTVHFAGTRAEWAEVAVSETGNEFLLAAAVCCGDD